MAEAHGRGGGKEGVKPGKSKTEGNCVVTHECQDSSHHPPSNMESFALLEAIERRNYYNRMRQRQAAQSEKSEMNNLVVGEDEDDNAVIQTIEDHERNYQRHKIYEAKLRSAESVETTLNTLVNNPAACAGVSGLFLDIARNHLQPFLESSNSTNPAPDQMHDGYENGHPAGQSESGDEFDVSFGEHEHYECERHSHVCVDGVPPDAPCDCCRHGHTLSSLIRPDDCKSCLRQMGGAHVSSRYPQIRQRMLKALNLKRYNSEESESKNVSPANNRHSSKREVVTIVKSPKTEDLDALVRMIEGTEISADPKKAAKKARQKERRIDEEKKREDEERRKREEEERILKEKELQEEEDRLKAEELKRLARKTKKKNRKKRGTGGISETSKLSETPDEVTGHSSKISALADGAILIENEIGHKANVGGNATVMEGHSQNSVPTDGTDNKSEMVTIRRHPSQPESVVTISLKGKHGGEDLLYYLINGQIYRNDTMDPNAKTVQEEDDSSEPKTSKKKKKKKKKNCSQPGDDTDEPSVNKAEKADAGKPNTNTLYSDRHGHSDIDLSKLKLPPGITITKVNNLSDQGIKKNTINPATSAHNSSVKDNSLSSASENFPQAFDSSTGDRKYLHNCRMEEDLFGHTENEEFEEVVSSKTRRKRNRAAKTKEPEEPESSIRSSPVSIGMSATAPYSRRAPSICDKPVENEVNKRGGLKAAQASKSGKSKYSRSSVNAKGSNGIENMCTTPNSRRERDSYHGSKTMGANVMPRIARAQAKNAEMSSRAALGNEGNFSPHVTVQPQSSPVLSTAKYEKNEAMGYLAHSPSNFKSNPDHYKMTMMTSEQSQPLLDHVPKTGQGHSVNLPGLKQWDQAERNQSSLSHVTRAADSKEESWSPWKEYNWTEGSTPENPSPRFGMEAAGNLRLESPSNTMSFQELMRKHEMKSPIQRPVPTPIDPLEMITRRETFSPPLAGVRQFNSLPCYSQPPTIRSQTDVHDINFKRPYGGVALTEHQHMMTTSSDDPYFLTPEECNIMHARERERDSQPTIILHQKNEVYDMNRDDNFFVTVLPHHPTYNRQQQQHLPEFSPVVRPTMTNDHQWSAFNANVAFQESEMLYSNPRQLNDSSIQTSNSSQSNWSPNTAAEMAWVTQQQRMGGLQNYDRRPLNLLHESLNATGQLSSQVQASHREPELPDRMSLPNGTTIQYRQDFTSGAQR